MPPLPINYHYQTVFMWFGVQWNPGPYGGVIQPVLTYGPSCCSADGIGPNQDHSYSADPYWYFSSQYVFGDRNKSNETFKCMCPDGNQTYRVSVGDTINSTMSFDLDQDAWRVISSSVTNGVSQMSVLDVLHPYNDSTLSWNALHRVHETVAEVCIETYNVLSAENQMPQVTWNTSALVRPRKDSDASHKTLLTPYFRPNVGYHDMNVTCDTAPGMCAFDIRTWDREICLWETASPTCTNDDDCNSWKEANCKATTLESYCKPNHHCHFNQPHDSLFVNKVDI